MAIDFNSGNLFKAPKINIIPEDVPLEAFEKSSEILNKRYETSADAATKAQEALNQQLQTAHPLEREALKSYYDKIYGDLGNIATKDDYIDQEWKTRSLALKTAANLQTQMERAKTAQETVDKIRTAKNITSPLKRKMWEDVYNKQFEKTSYDPNTGLINFGTLNAPRIVEDADVAGILNQKLAGFAADAVGKDIQSVQIVKPGEVIPGTNVISNQYMAYDIAGKRRIEQIKESDIIKASDGIIKSDPSIQAYLESEKDLLKYQNPQLTDVEINALIEKNIINPAKTFAKEKYGFTRTETGNKADLNASLSSVVASVFGTPANEPIKPWIGHTSDVDVTEPVKRVMDEKAEVASQAFNKDGSFKSVPSTWIENYAKLTGWMAGDINDLPNSNNFSTLVPEKTQAVYKAYDPTLTQKQMYEKFMDEKANYKKRMLTNYTIADSEIRRELNQNLGEFASTFPLYDREGNEITDLKTKTEILKQQASFVPATGQLKFGSDHASGMGVMNPNSPGSNHTQQILTATSKMIDAALNPETFNASTRDMFPEGIKVNYNGQILPVTFRVMKTNVGKKVIGDNQRLVYPSNIQMVIGGPDGSGKVVKQFRVDDQPEGQQGMDEFINFMLNNAALKYTL